MNFDFSEEQELLRTTARDFLLERSPMKAVREILEKPHTHSPALWSEMAELGWLGLGIPEEYGGSGLGIIELGIILDELGRALVPVPFLPTAIASQAVLQAGDEAQKRHWLPRIADGGLVATLAIDEPSGCEDFAKLETFARRSSEGGESWVLDGCKLFVPDAQLADVLVVVARIPGDGVGLFMVPSDAAGVAVDPMESMDPLRTPCEVTLDGVAVDAEALLGGNRDASFALARLLDRACVLIATEMVGGAGKCLDDAVDHARQREQFGKPIGTYQAIKHKCADMLFEVESARSIAYYAAWAADAEESQAPLTSSMAKAYVGDAYRHVSSENIQIHGGVGFTWEYDCHLYFKRAVSDATWLGDARYHRERVAQLLEI